MQICVIDLTTLSLYIHGSTFLAVHRKMLLSAHCDDTQECKHALCISSSPASCRDRHTSTSKPGTPCFFLPRAAPGLGRGWRREQDTSKRYTVTRAAKGCSSSRWTSRGRQKYSPPSECTRPPRLEICPSGS